jgi:SpoIID/LytB domain protein
MIRRRSLTAACATVASAAVLGGGIVLAIGTSAWAERAATVPPSRTMPVLGHGWGHGHGMSQEGANGAASVRHLSATQITSFYYPHTTAGSTGNPAMRIKLSGVPDNYVDVGRPAGSGAALVIHDSGGTNYQGTLPADSTKWRFSAGSAGIYTAKYTASGWVSYAPGGNSVLRGPLSISYNSAATAAAPIRILASDGSETDYRGSLRLIWNASGDLSTVSMERMDDYLLGVVPRESSSSWPAAALQAQAIAARSYAEYEHEHSAGRDYDICDSTSCQVFGGSRRVSSSGSVTNLEPASTNDAVRSTTGVVRLYAGKAIFAQYSASNGGWSTDGGAAYLIAQADPYDGLTNTSSHSWSASLPASALESRYPSIGTLRSVRVTQRDGHGEWGGRVLEAVLSGSAGSVTVTGSDIYHAYSWPSHSSGLRHQWFEIGSPSLATVADFNGDGISDHSVYRPSTGYWYFQGQGSTRWGLSHDVPVPGDYDGNGRTDIAVYRASSGQWLLKGKPIIKWGTTGDIPVPADYTGDGVTDIAVYRPSTGSWYLRAPNRIVRWGLTGDVPVPGDYDGNGLADFAVWRPSNGHWYVSGQGTTSYGLPKDVPVPGDYTGDGKTDFAVFRPSEGKWYVGGSPTIRWGTAGDVPVPGDYTGDGATDRVVWRPSTGRWYTQGQSSASWGLSGDEPLPLPYAIYRAR